MSNPEITHNYLLDQQHEQTAADARAKVQAYIARHILHPFAGTYENEEDENESKNA